MNNCVLGGFLQKKTEYYIDTDGVTVFRFLLNVYCHAANKMSQLPVVCKGILADQCYAKLKVGYYLEVVGEQARKEGSNVTYTLANAISYRTPKGTNVVHIRTTELFECFDTTKVLERMNPKNAKKKS